MADAPVVHIGENSPEWIAYKLLLDINRMEKTIKDRKGILDTYAECLNVVRRPDLRVQRGG